MKKIIYRVGGYVEEFKIERFFEDYEEACEFDWQLEFMGAENRFFEEV